jgi:hypothetical protein
VCHDPSFIRCIPYETMRRLHAVKRIITVGEFYEKAAGGQIIFT